MREIKFRAWCVAAGRFIDLNGFDIAFDGLSDKGRVYQAYEQGSIASYVVGELELMQYTGLKDANGNEIYEGDIIDVGGLKPCVCSVQWNNENASFCTYSDGVQSESLFGADFGCIVIGNIHENPELLEKPK